MWRIHVPLPLAFSPYLYHWPLSGMQHWTRSTWPSGSNLVLMPTERELANLVTYQYYPVLLLAQEIVFQRQKMSLHLETCPLNPPLFLNSGSPTPSGYHPEFVLLSVWFTGAAWIWVHSQSKSTPKSQLLQNCGIFFCWSADLWCDQGNSHILLAHFLLLHWHTLYFFQCTVCLIFACKAPGRGKLLESGDLEHKDAISGTLWDLKCWTSWETSLYVHPIAFIDICHCPLPNTVHREDEPPSVGIMML